jgi:hypothetical protein
MAQKWNEQMVQQGPPVSDKFEARQGCLYFTGESSPAFAVDHALDAIGLDKGYGTGGIDPYKAYTYEEYQASDLSKYETFRGLVDAWDRKIGKGNLGYGYALIAGCKKYLGNTTLRDMHEQNLKVAGR